MANINKDVSGSAYRSSQYRGDQRTIFPEINIEMNIKSMLPSPAIDLSDSTVAGTILETFNDKDATHITGSAGECGTIEISDDTDNIYPHNKTFWRSIVITFSNVNPSKYNNLDEYLQSIQEDAMGLWTNPVTCVDHWSKYVSADTVSTGSHLGPSCCRWNS